MTAIFDVWVYTFISGIGLGFLLGFICWGIGFGIYGIIKLFKMA